mgnify:CR=1 FL=1
MKSSEIAFVTEQLADMVRSGVPLPESLRRLASDGQRARTAQQLNRLEQDLAGGMPLTDALERSGFPHFVQRLLAIGASGGDLAGMLRRIADYYRRRSELEMRFSGLLVYPLMVLLCIIALFLTSTLYVIPMLQDWFSNSWGPSHLAGDAVPFALGSSLAFWVLAGIVTAALFLALSTWWSPALRSWLTWRLPPFRTRNVSDLTWMLAVCIRNGMPLKDTVQLIADLDPPPVSDAMRRMDAQLSEGVSDTEALAASPLLPPMAGWMIRSSGRHLPDGLEAVAGHYERQAAGQADIALYTFLPMSTVLLGLLVLNTYMVPFRALAEALAQLGVL